MWRVAPGKNPLAPAQVLVCVSGVWLQETHFPRPPEVIKLSARPGGGELTVGKERFRCAGDLEGLARRLERWFRYAFQDFLPQTDAVTTWQSPDRATILRSWGAVPCPECRRFLLPRVGQVGIALDETATAAKA